MNTPQNKTVPCPQCKKPTVFDSSNPFRPFCSDRCRLIDLGQWADEKYSIAGEAAHDLVNQNRESDPESDEEKPYSPQLH